ncbi:hypothetical protein D3C79_1087830 [compost metagenome]
MDGVSRSWLAGNPAYEQLPAALSAKLEGDAELSAQNSRQYRPGCCAGHYCRS